MKLVRYGLPGCEKPGLIDGEGRIRDLSAHCRDIAGPVLAPEGLEKIAALDPTTLPLIAKPVRLGPCVGRSGKFICVDLNYADHAAENGSKIADEPVLSMKATSAISGPNDPIIIPRHAMKTDWEVELGVIIGKTASYVREAVAIEHIAGYCVLNDITERTFQFERGGQWTKGKSADSFGPIGPWLVTRDEIPDPQDLKMWLSVDHVMRQNGSTRTMIFGVRRLVSYISQFMSLHPGDIIATGTPSGVGMGLKPLPVYLRPGQIVRLGIEGLGEQVQKVVSVGEVQGKSE